MTFSEKQKQREFIASRPTLQEIVKEVLQMEGKQCQLEVGTAKELETGQILCVNIRDY